MQIPTGIEPLDEQIGGGVRPGTLTVVSLPQGAHYAPLLRASIGVRSSLLLTTIKSKQLTANSLERSPVEMDAVSIHELDPGTAPSMVPELLRTLDSDTDLYVDTIGPVEETLPTDIYIDLLNTLSEELHSIGTTGFLYCYSNRTESYNAIVTHDIADIVLELERFYNDTQIGYRLRILKSNGTDLTASERSINLEFDSFSY